MKNIFTLLIICAVFEAKSQNWQTVVVADTNLFVVTATGADSMWNHYVRTIWVDSAINIVNGVKNYFYPSVRLDQFENIDTANGGTWLGKFNIRHNNGDEYYLNQYEDSILIKTWADLNDSWILCEKNGTEYHATVTDLNQIMIDGLPDSVKKISLQAYQGGLPVANHYNNLNIVLSKNHGFYTCFELFGFPDKVTATVNMNSGFPLPYLPLVHSRLDSNITCVNIAPYDFLWKFKPGNEWINYWQSNLWHDWGFTHDSIINSQMLTPTSMQVTRYRHAFVHYKIFPQQQNPYDTFYHSYQTFTDTVVQTNTTQKIIKLPLESKAVNYWFSMLTNRFHWFFIDSFCGNKIVIRDTANYVTPVSGSGNSAGITIEGFGSKHFYDYDFQGPGPTTLILQTLIYLKLDSCIEGTKLDFKSLSTNDLVVSPADLEVFPNPGIDNIYFKYRPNLVIQSYQITDLTGKIYLKDKFSNPVAITSLPVGLYLLQLNTNNGVVYRKFIKE